MPRGLLFPFERVQSGDFANGSGAELAIAKVLQVIGTEPGEIDTNPEFGCPLRNLRHKNNTPMLEAMAESKIRDAFDRWLPSLVVVALRFEHAGRRMTIVIQFNERTSSAAKSFPNDLEARVPVSLAA